MALTAARSIPQALLNPLLHPMDAAHTLLHDDGSFATAKKVTEVAVNTIKVWVFISPGTAPNLSETLRHCKFLNELSKTFGTERTFYSYTDRSALGYHYSKLDVVELAAITFSSAAQVFFFMHAYVTPQLCSTISIDFVAFVGTVASATGSQTVVLVAKAVTDIGLGTLQKSSLIIFLSIQGYNTGKKLYYRNYSAPNRILNEFKTVESLGKAAILVMIISGVGTPVILASSAAISFWSVAGQLQKDLA